MLKRALHKNLGVPRDRKRRKRESIAGTLGIDLCTEASGIERKRKRGELSMIDKNVKLKQTKGTVNSNGVEIRVECVDYISHLPETVIHLILSLLRSTKDAARTSTLSKRWRDLWTSFSVLAFDQRKFQKPEGVKDKKKCNAMFKEFVDKSLQSHFDRNLGIYKLVLHVNSFDQDMVHRIEKWIGLAAENKTKEIGFHAHKKICGRYTVPRNVFASETITGLRLEGCRVDTSSNIKLPNLQKLYLRKIHFDESIIINLITSCPLINDLRLILCSGLNNLQISSLLKLYRVEVHYCHGLAMIEIKAPSLETFWFCGKKYMSCKIKLAACESLKRLTLEDSRMTDNQFHDRFFRFPLLEKLDLHKCLNLKNIRIASHRLKTLVLRGCKKLADVEIDTPNLLSFEYEGDEMPFSFLNPVSLKEAKLSFAPVRNFISEPEWFLKMREFLGKLDHRAFKLVVYTNKNVIIHENIREISLPPNCGLKFELIQSSVGSEELLDSSLQKRQLETLSIVSSSSSEFLKLVREKITRKEDPTCCTSMNSTNKCWRHFLKDARMVNLKAAKHVAPWMAWLKSHPRVNEITCFRLKWKSDKDGKEVSR
ncbi:hypothetical protein ACFX13_025486 [Malus domestica]|uniref:F-box/LRR-repeat protein At2g42730-like n=1 Tax=Malus domestica TaxID=3750 RepID=UPI000498C0F0|nr:F-box/LRR-repeat protein At2g42730-like [Malus domestica]XP_028953047.1 F-box/LRR-repeat protein At2g42730-like [Malus domestica]